MRVAANGRLRSIDVPTLPYPGIATDYKPLIITMLSVADGAGIVTENLYPGRFRYVEELIRLGANIRTTGHHAVVRGVPRLSGAPVRAHDIRAGAAMVVAGLAADGVTTVSGVHHIDRGYDDLVGRLAASAPASSGLTRAAPAVGRAARRPSVRRVARGRRGAWRSPAADDHDHRGDDEKDLVPPALMGEQRSTLLRVWNLPSDRLVE